MEDECIGSCKAYVEEEMLFSRLFNEQPSLLFLCKVGKTALHIAAEEGNINLCLDLTAAGASLGCIDQVSPFALLELPRYKLQKGIEEFET